MQTATVTEQSGEGVFCNPTASQTHTGKLLSHLGVTWPPILPEGRQRLGYFQAGSILMCTEMVNLSVCISMPHLFFFF